jgi:hypothetical protein
VTQASQDLGWAVEGPPVGIWSTELGTAGVLMSDTLCLRHDGTGYLSSASVLRGEETYPLRWRHEGPGVLRIAVRLPGDDPLIDDPHATEWETVRYAAAVAVTDVGSRPVLRNVDDDSFWSLAGPVALISTTPD